MESASTFIDDVKKSSYMNIVTLNDWWLMMTEDESKVKRLRVAGTVSANVSVNPRLALRPFTSAPIATSLDPFTLVTDDGIHILLEGKINEPLTLASGFSSKVFNFYLYGFPLYCWDELARKCFEPSIESTGEEVAKEQSPTVEAVTPTSNALKPCPEGRTSAVYDCVENRADSHTLDKDDSNCTTSTANKNLKSGAKTSAGDDCVENCANDGGGMDNYAGNSLTMDHESSKGYNTRLSKGKSFLISKDSNPTSKSTLDKDDTDCATSTADENLKSGAKTSAGDDCVENSASDEGMDNHAGNSLTTDHESLKGYNTRLSKGESILISKDSKATSKSTLDKDDSDCATSTTDKNSKSGAKTSAGDDCVQNAANDEGMDNYAGNSLTMDHESSKGYNTRLSKGKSFLISKDSNPTSKSTLDKDDTDCATSTADENSKSGAKTSAGDDCVQNAANDEGMDNYAGNSLPTDHASQKGYNTRLARCKSFLISKDSKPTSEPTLDKDDSNGATNTTNENWKSGAKTSAGDGCVENGATDKGMDNYAGNSLTTDHESRKRCRTRFSEGKSILISKDSKPTSKSTKRALPPNKLENVSSVTRSAVQRDVDAEEASPHTQKTKRKLNFNPQATPPAKARTMQSPMSSGRSRSGRLLIPPVEFWNGQMAKREKDGTITGISQEDGTITWIQEDDNFASPACRYGPQRRQRK